MRRCAQAIAASSYGSTHETVWKWKRSMSGDPRGSSYSSTPAFLDAPLRPSDRRATLAIIARPAQVSPYGFFGASAAAGAFGAPGGLCGVMRPPSARLVGGLSATGVPMSRPLSMRTVLPSVPATEMGV